MWCSLLIVQRGSSRARSRLAPSFVAIHNQWIFVPNPIEEEDDWNAKQQRRRLTTRRHGWKPDSEEKPKGNFAKEYLEPAARGELKEKHSAGIPKLAVRKSKGHEIHGPTFEEIDDEELEEKIVEDVEEDSDYYPSDDEAFQELREGNDLVETMNQDITRVRAQRDRLASTGRGGGGGAGSGGTTLVVPGAAKPKKKLTKYNMWGEVTSRRDPEYWHEEEFDVLTDAHRAFFRQTYGNDGSLIGLTKETLDEIRASGFKWDIAISSSATAEEASNDEGEAPSGEASNDEGEAPSEEANDNEEGLPIEASAYAAFEGKVPPGRIVVGGRDDREKKSTEKEEDDEPKIEIDWTPESGRPITIDEWEAVVDEEEDGPIYADIRRYNYHPESKREPIPCYPKNRKLPHPLIVEFYSRWMYVTGLPPALTEAGTEFGDKKSKLTVPQEQEIQKTVTRLFGVSSERVYPANETSAFVGFESPESREQVMKKGPSDKNLTKPVTISLYTPSEDDNDDVKAFVKDVDEASILKLEGVPPNRFTTSKLAHELFPEGSSLNVAYPLTEDKVFFLSPSTVLLRFFSKDHAESALSSTEVANRLKEIGTYPVRLFQARRNIAHHRMEDPTTEIRKLGHKLFVDGEMPSKFFYISHPGVLMLQNLTTPLSKDFISDFFQPFSDIFRDVNGSIEFVTCYNGVPTDTAYVGFERLGEAESVMEHFKGRAQIGDNMVHLKLVKDRKIPGMPARRVRPERSEEEILKNLDDWEQYVDSEDVKYLVEHGVEKAVLDEALRGLRYHNPSFKALDWAMQSERIETDRESGADYREMVQVYIEQLKECIATPEDPGPLYEAMHFPGEKIDLSIFETEKQRIKKLMKKREGRE